MTLDIKTADELVDAELEARWAARRAAREDKLLQRILRMFVERGAPIGVAEIRGAVPDALARLDEEDLILLRDGRVELAYPFSGLPTPFLVILPDGRERYACCAIDALGIAPMLGLPVRIQASCHHCRGPLEFFAGADGPDRDAEGIMVWVGKRGEGERRISTGL